MRSTPNGCRIGANCASLKDARRSCSEGLHLRITMPLACGFVREGFVIEEEPCAVPDWLEI